MMHGQAHIKSLVSVVIKYTFNLQFQFAGNIIMQIIRTFFIRNYILTTLLSLHTLPINNALKQNVLCCWPALDAHYGQTNSDSDVVAQFLSFCCVAIKIL